eukprot:2245157-Prorocentrum_lima.AAC.1
MLLRGADVTFSPRLILKKLLVVNSAFGLFRHITIAGAQKLCCQLDAALQREVVEQQSNGATITNS